MNKRSYMMAMIYQLNYKLLKIPRNSPEFHLMGRAFAQEILSNLLRLGAPSDTIVTFNPNWKG